jgi:hypothetical protein
MRATPATPVTHARTPGTSFSRTPARDYKSPENSKNQSRSETPVVHSRSKTPDSSSRVINELKRKLYEKDKEVRELQQKVMSSKLDTDVITTKLELIKRHDEEVSEKERQIKDLKVLVRTYEEKFKHVQQTFGNRLHANEA